MRPIHVVERQGFGCGSGALYRGGFHSPVGRKVIAQRFIAGFAREWGTSPIRDERDVFECQNYWFAIFLSSLRDLGKVLRYVFPSAIIGVTA
jgi:hypothetical protein